MPFALLYRLTTSPALSGPCALRALCPSLPYALRTPLFLSLRSSQQTAHLAAPHTRLAALIARPAQLWLTHTLVLRWQLALLLRLRRRPPRLAPVRRRSPPTRVTASAAPVALHLFTLLRLRWQA